VDAFARASPLVPEVMQPVEAREDSLVRWCAQSLHHHVSGGGEGGDSGDGDAFVARMVCANPDRPALGLRGEHYPRKAAPFRAPAPLSALSPSVVHRRRSQEVLPPSRALKKRSGSRCSKHARGT